MKNRARKIKLESNESDSVDESSVSTRKAKNRRAKDSDAAADKNDMIRFQPGEILGNCQCSQSMSRAWFGLL